MAVAIKRNGINCCKILEYNGVDKADVLEFQGHAENSPSPTVYYTFETGSGSTVVDRSVGTTAHSGAFGTPTVTWDTDDPKSGSYSLLFDAQTGPDDHVELTHHSDLDWERTDAFSVSCWVKADSGGTCAIYTKRLGSTTYQGLTLSITSGRLDFYLLHDWADTDEGIFLRGQAASPFNQLADGSWHHVCYTYSGSATASGVEMYVDGQRDTSKVEDTDRDAITSSTTTTVDPYLGADTASGGLPLGDLDEFAIWSGTELTPAQVAVLYGSGTPPAIARGL